MTPFRLPLPGETREETDERLETMIRFVIHRHHWPRARALDLLDILDERVLASIRLDMREAAQPRTYAPFDKGFEV